MNRRIDGIQSDFEQISSDKETDDRYGQQTTVYSKVTLTFCIAGSHCRLF